MKMNLKYAIMAAALMGLAGCSNNDDDAVDNGLPVEGAKSFATIVLKSDAVTRAEAYFGATDAEKELNTVKVYVFNSLKVLEQIQVFSPAEVSANKKTFETTAGTHYFMAVANYPELNIPLGTSMDYMSQTIANINEGKFMGYLGADVKVNGTGNGFFMTSGVFTDDTNGARYYRSHDYAEAVLAATDKAGNIPQTNVVSIPIGRAMAKVNLAILENAGTPQYKLTYGQQAYGEIDVATTTYTVANNPDQMYYFPYFGTAQRFQTPTYDFYNTSVAPSNYWPALHQLDVVPTTSNYAYKTIAFSNTFDKDEANMEPFYVLENSNTLPTYGNATIISVKTRFTPDATIAWEDVAIAPAPGTTFYRVYNSDNREFVANSAKGFWTSESAAETFAATVVDLTGNRTGVVVKYTDAICYYIIPLKNKKRVAAPEWYDVVRNHFYDVVITKINGCGYSEPGGGDGPGVDTEPTDPLDPEMYQVEASIEVKNWIHVIQEEEIGIRP